MLKSEIADRIALALVKGSKLDGKIVPWLKNDIMSNKKDALLEMLPKADRILSTDDEKTMVVMRKELGRTSNALIL